MIKFKDFIKDLELNLEENSSIDISHLNKTIKSYNHKINQVEYKKILRVIRKKDDFVYIVKTPFNSLECSLDHKFCIGFGENDYKTVEELVNERFEKVEILGDNGFESIAQIEKTDILKPIYDLEVEDNHNLFTNNLLSHNSMGDPTTVSGGKAIPFYAHGRIRITRSEIDRENKQNVIKYTIIKNKMTPPFKVGTIVYNWETGFDLFSEIADLAIEFGVIKKEGNSYFFPNVEDFKVVGKGKAVEYLKDNPEYTKETIEPLVKEVLDRTDLRKDEVSVSEISN